MKTPPFGPKSSIVTEPSGCAEPAAETVAVAVTSELSYDAVDADSVRAVSVCTGVGRGFWTMVTAGFDCPSTTSIVPAASSVEASG